MLFFGCSAHKRFTRPGHAGPARGPSGTGRVFQKGVASYYAHEFHGRKTANGERYDMHALTAAHKTLPFNTRVKVVNLDNGKSVAVRINDRGPFAKNRIIDLSLGAAKRIGLIGPGSANVKLIIME
jgi:rare lipoprotein A